MRSAPRFALVGRDVSHSLSKRIHEALFPAPYDLLSVPEERFDAEVPRLIAGYDGFNVTMPYKGRILPYLAGASEAVLRTGSCNSVRVENGRLYGETTDGAGLLRSLEGVANPSGKNVLILGAGGAAASVIYALSQAGARLTVANRTVERAEKLVENLKIFANTRPLSVPFCEKYDIIINTTSVGLGGGDASPLDLSKIPVPDVAADIIAFPLETAFLRQAAARGAVTVNGLGMLFWQAVFAEEFWRGEKVERVVAERALAALRKEIEA